MFQLYRATNFIDVLSLIRNGRRGGRGTYSYRQLADKLEYRSPRTLAMVHKGQRPPSRNLVSKIVRHFPLTPYEEKLVVLFAEKAIADRRQVNTKHLDVKIDLLRESAREFYDHADNVTDEPLIASLYLGQLDLEILRKLLRLLLVEAICKYGDAVAEKEQYQVELRIDLASI